MATFQKSVVRDPRFKARGPASSTTRARESTAPTVDSFSLRAFVAHGAQLARTEMEEVAAELAAAPPPRASGVLPVTTDPASGETFVLLGKEESVSAPLL